MHYRLMLISERLCCCMDTATGSMLTGIYTSFLSLAFVAVGIDSMVEASKEPHSREDLTVINAIFGLVIALSVLFLVASVSLVIGAAGKFKTYLIMWIILAPFWTTLAFCQLIVLPMYISGAVSLTDYTSRVCGTVFILITNLFCMFCVYLFFATLSKSPVSQLRSLGVVEALESGFSSGYSRLRESIRPSKSKTSAMFRSRPAADPVSLPEVSVAVVLDPNRLESSRSNPKRSSSNLPVGVRGNLSSADVGERSKRSLSSADQLGTNHPQRDGFDNVAFYPNNEY